jgi:hypothetical protein
MPPERDRIDGWMLDIFRFSSVFVLCFLFVSRLYEPGGRIEERSRERV